MKRHYDPADVPSMRSAWPGSECPDSPYGAAAGVLVAESVALDRDFVLSRSELADLGIDKYDVEREIAHGRWVALGRHTIGMHRGPLTERGLWRHALVEVGSGAALDGASALARAGLQRFDSGVFISVRHGWQPQRIPGVVVKEVRGWSDDDVIDGDVRRVKAPLAAIRGAAWAVSDRQAALLLLMTCQQRIARGADLAATIRRFERLRRRALIAGVVADILDGVQSMGELDFARECRRRGLPEPSRQVIRKGLRGRVYLDVFFDEFGIIVEIEGAHHVEPLNAVDDALRQNHLSGGSEGFLRIPVVGLRIDLETFMRQLEAKLVARGWVRR